MGFVLQLHAAILEIGQEQMKRSGARSSFQLMMVWQRCAAQLNSAPASQQGIARALRLMMDASRPKPHRDVRGRILRCFRRNSAPLYCVCARVGHTPPVRQHCGVPVAKETTTAAHAMCAAAGWYVELTQRGLLQELGRDCGHMAARNAPKQLQCMQCELYKSRDAYKTKQWTEVRAGDRL